MDTAIPSISVSALHRLLGSPASPLILDVRRAPAYEADRVTLPAALRRVPDGVASWGTTLPHGRRLIACCVHGHEVSQEVARALLQLGADASYLEGGIEAWKQSGAPTLLKSLPEMAMRSPTRWVTRERPKIDRIACPWLIRRFIDPLAEFVYVPAAEVADAARLQAAIPYDIPDVRFSHRGVRCSFDALVEDFDLRDPALDELAGIVRGADTGRPDLTPQSAGLLAISIGLSANFTDDHAMLEQGMVVYDALYAWLSRVRGEAHNAKLFQKS